MVLVHIQTINSIYLSNELIVTSGSTDVGVQIIITLAWFVEGSFNNMVVSGQQYCF